MWEEEEEGESSACPRPFVKGAAVKTNAAPKTLEDGSTNSLVRVLRHLPPQAQRTTNNTFCTFTEWRSLRSSVGREEKCWNITIYLSFREQRSLLLRLASLLSARNVPPDGTVCCLSCASSIVACLHCLNETWVGGWRGGENAGKRVRMRRTFPSSSSLDER